MTTMISRARFMLGRFWAALPAVPPVLVLLTYAAAGAAFTVAALVAGFVAVLLLLGLYDIGVQGWAAAVLVTAATTGLGVWCVHVAGRRADRPGWGRGRHRRVWGSTEPEVALYDPAERDRVNERLEHLLDLPTRRPAHDYRVRPPVPPSAERLDSGGEHG